MRKSILAGLVVVVAAILIFSFTPLRYMMQEQSYTVSGIPDQNISAILGANGQGSPVNVNFTPPGLINNGTTPVLSFSGNMSPTVSGGSIHIVTNYWAYYNSSSHYLISIAEVNLTTGGKVTIAPGLTNAVGPNYRSKYQYSSHISMLLPKNGSAVFASSIPDNSVFQISPSHFYMSYGGDSQIPFWSPSYGTGNAPAGSMFTVGLNMSYFFLNTMSLTGHNTSWEFYDMNYGHSISMHNDTYMVSTAFIPTNGTNYITLALSDVFSMQGGFVHKYYIYNENYTIPLNMGKYVG